MVTKTVYTHPDSKGASGPTAERPVVTSVRVMTGLGRHDEVTIWNRGGCVGTLFVEEGDGHWFASQLLSDGYKVEGEVEGIDPRIEASEQRKAGKWIVIDRKGKRQCLKPSQAAEPGDVFVCEKPHDDDRYDYVCDFAWCRCRS